MPALYQPLNSSRGEIRLLRLLPSPPPSIACSLTHFPLASAPPYVPISYCWGDTAALVHITVDDQPFLVTHNLFTVLSTLSTLPERRGSADSLASTSSSASHEIAGDGSGYYWVDAICIDQSSQLERSQQVARMRHIYESPSVFISLGAASPLDEEALRVIEQLAGASFGWEAENTVPHVPALAQFFGKAWFSRMWIVQEIVAPRRIDGRVLTSGAGAVTFRNVFKVAMTLGSMEMGLLPAEGGLRWQLIAGLRRCCLLGQVLLSWNYCASESLFVALLWACRDQEATDPRDKIYALLGLFERSQLPSILAEIDLWEGEKRAPNFERALLCVDYNASVEDVYASVVMAVVAATGRLDIICACQERGRFVRSWTPDFSRPWNRTSLLARNMMLLSEDIGDEGAVYASGNRKAEATFSEDSKVMTVKGIWYTTIFQIEEPWSSKSTNDELNYVQSWMTIMNTPGGQKAISRFGSTTEASKRYFETLLATEDSTTIYGSDVIGEFGIGRNKAWYERALEEVTFRRRWILINEGRRVAVTESGHFSLVPEHAQPGDIICVLLGCSVPVVLRKNEDRNEFVGECFLNGIMQGELVENLDALAEFALR